MPKIWSWTDFHLVRPLVTKHHVQPSIKQDMTSKKDADAWQK